MDGDPIGASEIDQGRSRGYARLESLPGLSDRRNMIDVYVKPYPHRGYWPQSRPPMASDRKRLLCLAQDYRQSWRRNSLAWNSARASHSTVSEPDPQTS